MTKQEEETGKVSFTFPTNHNDHPGGDDLGNQKEEEDEFFGNQEEDDDENHGGNDFGALGRHESRAKDRDLAAIGYFESYDETKDSRIQEGFEAGYRQTFDASLRVGELFGQWMAQAEFLDDDDDDNHEAVKQQSSTLSRRLHEFLVAFQSGSIDPTMVQESLEALEEEMKQARIE